MRSFSLLLALPLFVACGKVTDSEPSELTAGGPSESPAGHASPPPAAGAGTSVEPSTGGVGGSRPTMMMPFDAGVAPPDASTPPKPAADGGSKEADAGTSHEPLCDGSDAMRLAFVSDGGFVQPTFGFTNPYGAAFLAIDGKCRYYAGQNYMRGLISGTLTTSEAAQLSADLHWNDLDRWPAWPVSKDQACPDAGGVSLTIAKASAGCSCGCDPAAPSGLEGALSKAYEWEEKLMSAGKPLDGPVSAIILETGFGGPSNQPKFDWPLSRAIKSIPNLIVDQADTKLWMSSEPWARFDDSADFGKLREMRSMTTNMDRAGSGSVAQDVIVREGGMEYHLFVRDELPAEVDAAWKAMRATVPMP